MQALFVSSPATQSLFMFDALFTPALLPFTIPLLLALALASPRLRRRSGTGGAGDPSSVALVLALQRRGDDWSA